MASVFISVTGVGHHSVVLMKTTSYLKQPTTCYAEQKYHSATHAGIGDVITRYIPNNLLSKVMQIRTKVLNRRLEHLEAREQDYIILRGNAG